MRYIFTQEKIGGRGEDDWQLSSSLFDTVRGIRYRLILTSDIPNRAVEINLRIASTLSAVNEQVVYSGVEALSFWEQLASAATMAGQYDASDEISKVAKLCWTEKEKFNRRIEHG